MKYVSRLIKNLILISIPLILICVYTFIYPMSYMAVEYPMWAEEKNYVNQPQKASNQASSPATLIIGDSRAKSGIIPSELAEDGSVYNISIGGASTVEMYYAVRNYLKNHEAPEKAFVIFAPYHFCELDNWNQTLYYNYLSLPELMEAETNALKMQDKNIHYTGWLPDILSFKLRLPNKYLDAIYTSRLGQNLNENREKYDSVRRDLGYTAFGEDEENNEVSYEVHCPSFDLSPMADHYYIKLLDTLKDAGVRVIVEQAPVNPASDEQITEEFREGYRSYLEKTTKDYPGITVEKEIPVYDKNCFGDNNHLNRRGAEKYTAMIREKYRLT